MVFLGRVKDIKELMLRLDPIRNIDIREELQSLA